MKTHPINHQQGSVLVATIVVVGIISLALGSYLSLVATQNRTVMSAYTWNTALPYAEAGIEEGLTHLVSSGGSNLTGNGWAAAGADWIRTNTIADGSYSVRISGAASNFTVVSTGTAPRISRPGTISRTVRITTERRPKLPGVVALTSLRIGANAFFDSYDSSDPLASTNGQYAPALAHDEVFVGTNGQTNSAVVGGSAIVMGSIATGPGGSIRTLGGATVGDSSWAGPGIQPGHSADDFNYHATDVLAPYATGIGPVGGSVDGTNYGAVLSLTGGQYFVNGNFSGAIYVDQPTTLYVTGSLSTSVIRIAPGASLKLYVGGSSLTVQNSGGGTGGLINEGGKPEDLSIYGLSGLTDIRLGGNAQFVGTIYAPSATLDANGTTDFFGAILVNRIDSLGSFQFHFDEALLKNFWEDFVVASWDEI